MFIFTNNVTYFLFYMLKTIRASITLLGYDEYQLESKLNLLRNKMRRTNKLNLNNKFNYKHSNHHNSNINNIYVITIYDKRINKIILRYKNIITGVEYASKEEINKLTKKNYNANIKLYNIINENNEMNCNKSIDKLKIQPKYDQIVLDNSNSFEFDCNNVLLNLNVNNRIFNQVVNGFNSKNTIEMCSNKSINNKLDEKYKDCNFNKELFDGNGKLHKNIVEVEINDEILCECDKKHELLVESGEASTIKNVSEKVFNDHSSVSSFIEKTVKDKNMFTEPIRIQSTNSCSSILFNAIHLYLLL